MNNRALILLGFFLSISLFSTCFDRVERKFYGVKPGVTMAGEPLEGLLPAELRLLLEELAIKEQSLAVEPALDKESGEIIPEQKGCIIDIEATLNRAIEAQEGERLELLIQEVSPHYSSRDLQAIRSSRGYFETWFTGNENRYTNISLACNSVNNSLLWPGQVFSFNECVGPRTPERGYMPAPVFIMGVSETGFGGGVCQVATTVFNAAEKARLEIIERHLHSQRVYYVDEGRDATVSYEDLDLKFSNNTDRPLIVKAGIERGKIWVNIMGEED